MDVRLKFLHGKHSQKHKIWELDEFIKVTLTDGYELTLPKGMETDLSSVPRFLWGVLPPFGDFLIATLVHDYLYKFDYRRAELGDREARKFADKEMLILSNYYNPNHKLDNYIRYIGVRLFGAKVYKR